MRPNAGPWVLAATILGIEHGVHRRDGRHRRVAGGAESLDATAVGAQWVVEAYTLLLASLVLVGGTLGDHLGRRRVFAAGIVLFALASVWSGLATGPEQ